MTNFRKIKIFQNFCPNLAKGILILFFISYWKLCKMNIFQQYQIMHASTRITFAFLVTPCKKVGGAEHDILKFF